MTACWPRAVFSHPPAPAAFAQTARGAGGPYLARRIRRPARKPPQPGRARRVDDARGPVHPLQVRPEAVEDALQVHPHDEIPIFIFRRRDPVAEFEDAGEVCGAVQRA